ncbi:MAG: ATP-binding protein [Paludibacteraceae bacterium]|nr:ATP-binding protein [Paludibacteraceae bacterium]
MEIPFIYGKIADGIAFTDRENETEKLVNNFKGLINTVIISPRRWGKTSLVSKALGITAKDKEYITVSIDIFNCRSEAEFYNAFASAVLKAGISKIEEFVVSARKYMGGLLPKISLGDGLSTTELSLGVDFKDKEFSVDEILDLPQKLAKDRGKKFIVCLDEFQNICEYQNPLDFQKKLRSHWQRHTSVCYCLYGSKRNMLLNIFGVHTNPFYKFGDIIFLNKISSDNWVKFITETFDRTGKSISPKTAKKIADMVSMHPYYVQQLAQQAWLRTEDVCSDAIVEDAFEGIIGQLNLLFCNLLDSLTAKQVQFLKAVGNGEKNFTSENVLKQYKLGTSANVKNLKEACIKKDIIDTEPGNTIVFQDPMFECWLKRQ